MNEFPNDQEMGNNEENFLNSQSQNNNNNNKKEYVKDEQENPNIAEQMFEKAKVPDDELRRKNGLLSFSIDSNRKFINEPFDYVGCIFKTINFDSIKKEPNNKYMGDFTNSSEHRYKYVGSKNHSNIASPSKVLHLSNLPAERDEEFFRELFRETGKIDKFIFMKNTENMALVEMSTIEEAIAILMFFHNFNIDGKYLKVSFSKYKKVK